MFECQYLKHTDQSNELRLLPLRPYVYSLGCSRLVQIKGVALQTPSSECLKSFLVMVSYVLSQ
jgi:hypothetical protein